MNVDLASCRHGRRRGAPPSSLNRYSSIYYVLPVSVSAEFVDGQPDAWYGDSYLE